MTYIIIFAVIDALSTPQRLMAWFYMELNIIIIEEVVTFFMNYDFLRNLILT